MHAGMVMKALVKTASGVRCLQLPMPRLETNDDVLIRVISAAICRTDLYAANGRIPVREGRVLGHEFAGVIEEVAGNPANLRAGDRVVVNPLLSCRRCPQCNDQRPHECATTEFLGLDRDGAFAQWIVVDRSQVFALPESLDFDIGAYAEPLAATLAILEAGLPPDGRIAVTGTGRIAELTRMILVDHGYDNVFACAAAAGNSSCDAVVETDLGSANAEAVVRMLRPGGLLVLKSRTPEALALPRLLCIARRLRVQSVYYADFSQALAYLERRASSLRSFVGSVWPLEAHETAFATAGTDRGEGEKLYFNPHA